MKYFIVDFFYNVVDKIIGHWVEKLFCNEIIYLEIIHQLLAIMYDSNLVVIWIARILDDILLFEYKHIILQKYHNIWYSIFNVKITNKTILDIAIDNLIKLWEFIKNIQVKKV